ADRAVGDFRAGAGPQPSDALEQPAGRSRRLDPARHAGDLSPAPPADRPGRARDTGLAGRESGDGPWPPLRARRSGGAAARAELGGAALTPSVRPRRRRARWGPSPVASGRRTERRPAPSTSSTRSRRHSRSSPPGG